MLYFALNNGAEREKFDLRRYRPLFRLRFLLPIFQSFVGVWGRPMKIQIGVDLSLPKIGTRAVQMDSMPRS